MAIPSKDEALQFAIMLQAGLPARDAILYFCPSDDPTEQAYMLQDWQRSTAVKRATLELMGRPWQELNLEEKRDRALELHYAQLAYFLFSHHYDDITGGDKLKADTARQVLEAHKAGTAGNEDALSRFFADINSGRVKLAPPVKRSN